LVMAPVLLTASPPARLPAQDTTAVPDTAARGVGPFGALWRSILVPGWGQAATDRHTAGAVLVAWEGVTIMMTFKARQEAHFLRETDSPLRDTKREEAEDWLVLWIFNHLFAGAEAYVAAHFRDFPPELKLRAVPGGGGGGISVSLALPRLRLP
jgi:hypothetical protein